MSSAIAAKLPAPARWITTRARSRALAFEAVPSWSARGSAPALDRVGGPRRGRILLAIDGSAAAVDACRAAAALARWAGARVLVLHIAEPNWPRSSLDRAQGAIAAEEAARTNGTEVVERARTPMEDAR
jgi:hypothetical protein